MERQGRSRGGASGATDGSVQRKPGKSTLTDAIPQHADAGRVVGASTRHGAVQARGPLNSGDVQQAAARGVAGPPTQLPHQRTIQALFGHHDVSGVGAHIGGDAEHATNQIGATAYATGDQVAFNASPDLHTAAHEAAHVVQQRGGVQLAGGVGQAGDRYEQNADAAADAVVAGRSAEALLDPFAAGSAATSSAIQRNEQPTKTTTPVGREEKTEFGTYWVVPDGTGPQVGVIGEQLSETEFAALRGCWRKLNDGSGQIKIKETDDKNKAYGGFKAKILEQFGKLLSKPVGRGVVTSLISAGHTVTIVPNSPRTIGGARRGDGSVEKADGSANTGGDSTILIEAGLKDTDIVCFDPKGKQISAPIFLILGHELIHATHNDAGRNHREKAATDGDAYPNLEEEETIATGHGATENKLRGEHGLGVRKGHRLADTRI